MVPLPREGSGKRRIKQALSGPALGALGAIAAIIRRRDAAPLGSTALWPWAEPPKTILLVRFDLLGDTVMSLYLANDLKARFPDAHVTFLTTPYSAQVAELCPDIDDTMAADFPALTHMRTALNSREWISSARLLRAIRTRRFDLAVSLYGPLAGTVAGLSGARRRVGYASEAPPGSLDLALPGRRAPGTRHEVEWIRSLGEAQADGRRIDLVVPPASALEWARGALPAQAGRPVVALHAGARTGSAKLWPPGHWRELAGALRREIGAAVIAVGDEAERDKAEWILDGEAEDKRNLAGATDVARLAAVLSSCDLLISSDSGPLHLAAALHTRVLGLYGPTDPSLSGPYTENGTAITAGLPCSPCYDLRAAAICPFGDTLCMRWIAPKQVLASARSLIYGGAP